MTRFLPGLSVSVGSGRENSPHVSDLREFYGRVNAMSRKYRFEAYPVVTGYGVIFLKLQLRALKWAYTQVTTRGWCLLHPTLSQRLDLGS